MTRLSLHSLGILSVAVIAGPVQNAAADDFLVEVRPSGLSELADVASNVLNQSFDAGTVTTEVYNCPIGPDSWVELSNAIVDISEAAIDLEGTAGSLKVSAILDLNILADLHHNGCIYNSNCTLNATANNVGFAASVSVTRNQSGERPLSVTLSDVSVVLEKSNVFIDIDDCFDAGVLQTVIAVAEGFILGKVRDAAADYMSTTLPTELERMLGTAIAFEVESGIELRGEIGDITVGARKGLAIRGTGNANATGAAPVSFEEPTASPNLSEAAATSDMAFAANDKLANQLLQSAFASGLLNSGLEEAQATADLSAAGIAQRLGLPDGTTAHLSFSIGAAPSLRFGRGDVNSMSLAVPDLKARVLVQAQGASDQEIIIQTSANVALRSGLAPGATALALDVERIQITKLEISTDDVSLSIDPARIETLVDELGSPLLSAALSRVPISPALNLSAQPSLSKKIYFVLDAVTAADGWLQGGFDLHVPSADDATAPTVSLVDPKDLIAAGSARFDLRATDNETPSALLRYRVWLDGAEVTEEPRGMAALTVSLEAGNHTLEVVALDLQGNQTPTAVTHSFVVDGAPPTLEVLEAPALVSSGVVKASWRATDDRDGVTTRWSVLALNEAGELTEEVASGEAGATGQLELTDLDSNRLYSVRIEAVDEAGNETSERYGISVGSSGGCSVSSSHGSSTALLVLLAIGLLSIRRRHILSAA